MSDEESNEFTDKAKALNIGAVVPELYKDAVSPAAKEIGKGLQTVAKAANLALKPISGLVWGYEKIEEFVTTELPKKMRGKSADNIITPEPHLAGPLLESLKYTGYKDSLRDMYLNLLATSMDKESATNAHPSFVEVIRQLSSDEAKLLSYFKGVPRYPEIDSEQITAAWYRFEPFEEIKRRFKHSCKAAGLEVPDLYLSYLDNLSRLKITEFRQNSGDILVDASRRGRDISAKQEINEYLNVTNFGQQFIGACVDE